MISCLRELLKNGLKKSVVVTLVTAILLWPRVSSAMEIQQFDKMAAAGENQTMKAASEVMTELQAKAAPYIALIKRIEAEAPLDMSTLKDKSDLAARRELGREMLRMNEAPAIEVHIVQNFEQPGGMGECGTSAIVPAIANAIFAATGKRLRKMPIDISVLKSV